MSSSTRAAIALVLIAITFSTAVRVGLAFSHPGFDRELPEGMLKSDPGLLYYVTARIVESGGLPPEDFRADPRIEHPETSDIPAMFTVGQEFLVAWAYLLLGGRVPLHTLAVWVMAFVASLAAVGVFGLAFELTRSVRWAAFALVLWALASGSYRSVSYILLREDLSLPLFALHLWLLARAARVRTHAAFALAGVAALAALATWHAMGFVVAVEVACLFAWFLRSGRSPLAGAAAWWVPGIVGLGALAVPVLRAKLFVLAPAMQIAAALGVAGLLEGRLPGRVTRIGVGVTAGAGIALLAWLATGWLSGGAGDYAHVADLVWAKLAHLGRLPDDPATLPFGARLLWKGPFQTGSAEILLAHLPVAGLLLPVAALVAFPIWRAGETEATTGPDRAFAVTVLFALAFAAIGVLIWRTVAVAALVAPPVAVALLARVRLEPRGAWLAGLALAQALAFASYVRTWHDEWYYPPHQAELRSLVGWMRAHLEDGGAVVSDFVTGPAILAHTGRAIVLQPKYETRRSRERIDLFARALYTFPLADFHRVVREDFDARYLVVDRKVLWAWRYHAGLPWSRRRLPPGTASAGLLSPDPGRYRAVPGFRLLHESAQLRLYAIEPDPGDRSSD